MQLNVAFKVHLRPTQQKEVDKYCRKLTHIATLFTTINQMPAKNKRHLQFRKFTAKQLG
jgi:inhibitor of KinA sporulation pathway (predicted exonuclease)